MFNRKDIVQLFSSFGHLSDPQHTECSNLTKVRWA